MKNSHLINFTVVILGVIAPNIIFISAAQWLGIGRPWLNLDYALAILLLAFGWRWSGMLLGLTFLLIDLLALTGQIMPFTRLSDIIYLLQFTATASTFHISLLVAIGILILCKWQSLRLTSLRTPKLHALIAFNILTALTVLSNSVFDDNGTRFYRHAHNTPVASQTANFISTRESAFLDFFKAEGDALSPLAGTSASAQWFLTDTPKSSRLLLVIAESWGASKDPQIQKALLHPLLQSESRTIEQGELEFFGVTLAGELRELCHLRPNHFNLAKLTSGFEDCLPNQLKNQGYTTAAMHGAVSLMYDRQQWYPRTGMEQTTFFESKIWPRRCYSFPGACDLDMLGEVENFFALPGKRFFYWLTLNSHSRYDPRDIRLDIFNCEKFSIPSSSESCRNLKLQAQFFHGLANTLNQKDMRDVEVIVVGDHSPVIIDLTEKNNFFKENTVPWIHIRDSANPSPRDATAKL